MRNGFKFKNIHSSEYGLSVKTKSRPIRPLMRTVLKSVPYRDGSYDFSSSNAYGREFYNDRSFSLSLSVYADSMAQMQMKLDKLSLWLCGKGELIFDDMPLISWSAIVSDEIIYVPEHNGRRAVVDVVFTAEPFSRCIFDVITGPCIGADSILLDANFPICIDEMFVYAVAGSGDITVMNIGNRPIRPVIKISGNVGNMVLSMNGRSLSFGGNGDVVIDFDKQRVENADGLVKVSGTFFEFQTGENILHIENSNNSELVVKVNYFPKFMYNLDFDAMDWSVGDA